MDIKYLKKAEGNLTATCTIPNSFFDLPEYPGDVEMPVNVQNDAGTIVTSATVNKTYMFQLLVKILVLYDDIIVGKVIYFYKPQEVGINWYLERFSALYYYLTPKSLNYNLKEI